MSNPPVIDKGKSITPEEVRTSDGFVPVKSGNQNRGQKRPFIEKQDDGTFNRFGVLDELSKQEVNPGLINLDHGLVDLAQEDPIIESTMDPLGEECRQLDAN